MKKDSVLSAEFPSKLRQLRMNKGWSQEQLGKKIGIESNRVSRYERAALLPSLEILAKIADIFEVSIDYLIRNDKDSAISKIGNKELIQRIKEVDALPPDYQEVLVTILDAFVKKYRFEQIAKG
jgi:transcriptional regulator with XRE-family HTH domain